MNEYKVTPEEFKILRVWVENITGVFLEDGKEYLIESRLGPLLSEAGAENFKTLIDKAGQPDQRKLLNRIVDSITTHETYFFRDQSPFDIIGQMLIPALIARNAHSGQTPSMKVWSAACSTGQEAYTILMALKEALGDLNRVRIHVLGTDISDESVAKASYGIYNKIEIDRGLAPERLNKYFTTDSKGWKISDELRAYANFQKANLLNPLDHLGKFDVIYCRNVIIYFSLENRKKLFEKIAGMLNPGGVLVLGATESLLNITDRFVRREHGKSVYYTLR